jgi:acetate kinase
MKILVPNVGSSSFKCQLLEMPAEKVLAKLLVERVGSDKATVRWTDRKGQTQQTQTSLKDMTAAISFVLGKLTDEATGVLKSLEEVDAVAFKPLCAKGGITGCQFMTDEVLAAMAEFSEYIAPMHNEACIKAVKSFRQVLPRVPMLGLFETFFFQDWPEHARIYAIPWDWTQKYNVRRSMGHGASHYFVNRRVAELLGKKPEEFNAVQMHLGGSSSLTGVRKGKTIDGTAGFTMQAGVPMSVRSSDMDGYLVAYLWEHGEGTPKQIVERMMTEAGLAGITGIGFDMRDLQEAASKGNERAALGIETYVYQVRKYLGSLMLVLGHSDVITMTAGTGESSPYIRGRILENLEEMGVIVDEKRNGQCIGREGRISREDSRIQVWVVPTNEEIVVARECARMLAGSSEKRDS